MPDQQVAATHPDVQRAGSRLPTDSAAEAMIRLLTSSRPGMLVVVGTLAWAGGCGDSTSPETLDPSDLRLAISSGDGQSAEVFDSSKPTLDNLLPQPLVLQVEDVAGNPIADRIPASVTVGFTVPTDGCGSAFVGSATPDAAGRVEERWVKGTSATECRLEARLIANGQPQIAEEFTATFKPGPIADWHWQGPEADLQPGDTLDLGPYLWSAEDEWGNQIATEVVVGSYPVEWAMSNRLSGGRQCLTGTGEGPTGQGWAIDVPDYASLGYPISSRQVDRDGEIVYLWRAYVRVDITNTELGDPGNSISVRQLVGETSADTLPSICT